MNKYIFDGKTVREAINNISTSNDNSKEIKITPPEGYEVDKENSTFDCIKFKPVTKRWRDTIHYIGGYYINDCSKIVKTSCGNNPFNYNVFATKKQAKSALAMARISQIIANDERFGGVVTDEEQENKNIWKYSINRRSNTIEEYNGTHEIDHFLSFHTPEQRDLFLKENEDLVKDYLMID